MYKIACFIVRWYYKIFFFAKVTGMENIPNEGGFAMCANHKSNNDPPLIASIVKKRMNFLSKKELCDVPVLGSFVKMLGAIPIDRAKRDTAAIKESMRVMKGGMGLLVFPQGTRMKSITPESVKPGMLSMAHKVGVPVIPVGIAGEYKLFSGIKVNIGTPITLEEIGEIIENGGERAEVNTKLSRLMYGRLKELAEEE